MNRKDTGTETNEARWLRVSLLTLTMIAPVVNSIMDYLRRRSEVGREAPAVQAHEQNGGMQSSLQAAQVIVRQRLDDLTSTTRQSASEQAQQLQKLAQDWSHDLRKRGEEVTVQSGKISHLLLDRGGKVTQDITERGSQITQELAKRGEKLSHDLSKQGDRLVQPLRRQGSPLLIFFGFSVGMVSTAVVTYLLVRKRVVERVGNAGQQIELPRDTSWSNGNQGQREKPLGEIRHLGHEGNTPETTIVQGVDVVATRTVTAPADAAFVGVVSTKRYYPVEIALDGVTDLIYFVSEEEAKMQGYNPLEA